MSSMVTSENIVYLLEILSNVQTMPRMATGTRTYLLDVLKCET
jgi:hypothetical protein